MPQTKEKVKRKYVRKTIISKLADVDKSFSVTTKDLSDTLKKTGQTAKDTAKPVKSLIDLTAKQQVDGKDYESPRARPRTLAELWGFRGDKFGTLDEELYKKRLSLMNKADLQRHCIEHGLMPHDARQTMVDRLLKIFRQHVAAANTNNVHPVPIPTPSDELRRVLNNLGGNNVL